MKKRYSEEQIVRILKEEERSSAAVESSGSIAVSGRDRVLAHVPSAPVHRAGETKIPLRVRSRGIAPFRSQTGSYAISALVTTHSKTR
jgi:hypothetical protein